MTAPSDRPNPPLVVLGLDPGSRVTGYGLVRDDGGRFVFVDAGVISLGAADMAARLGRIHTELSALIVRHCPVEAALENVFVSRNTMSAIKLGQARGAAMAACAVAGLPVASYEPTVVKKAVVGVGRADKDQVAFMIARVLGVSGRLPADASDALAVAVCHLNERRMRRLTGCVK